MIRDDLRKSDECAAQYVSELEIHHSDFVTTFDYVIETGVPDDFPDLLGGTIKPFVDDDKLPRLVDTLASTVALLISDEFDPNRETIQALVNLSETRTLIESSVAIQLVSAILTDDTITDKVHALAVIAQEDDGVTYVMDDLLDVASFALESDPTPSTCSGVTTPDAQSTLLRTAGFVEDARYALGSPFYIARPDENGNPRVLSDGGMLRGPFVDVDGDLVADVNAELEPIDANGNVISLDMVGEDLGTGRDEFGRAVDASGAPIYDYYDVKRTALSYSMQVGADLFERDLHHELPAIIGSVLGTPTVCSDGTNCRIYPSAGNTTADLAWLVFELAEYNRISVLMNTLTELCTVDATKADRLLVAIGDIIRAFDQSNLQLTDTTLTDAFKGLVPLLAQIFSAPTANGMPTATLVVNVLEDLGAEADALPEDINYMLRNQYDPDGVNDMETVDFSQPRFTASGDDNRTGLEQISELFEYGDCGYIGGGGTLIQGLAFAAIQALDPNVQSGTVSEVFVSLLSDQDVEAVKSLVDILVGATSIPGIGNIGGGLISALGCSSADANQMVAHLPAASILADSGGLDWILPVAQAFRDQGQLPVLIDIFGYLAVETRRDEDASPTTHSAIRQLGPALVTMTSRQVASDPLSTPLNRVIDAARILLTINASDGNGNSMDLLIDALAYMTATRTIQTRPVTGTTPGTTSSSFALLFLDQLRTFQSRVAQGGAADELTRLVDGITPLFTETTGSGASRRLANPNLRLMLATYTSVIADATSLPQADYLCYVHDLQTESAQFMTSKHFATGIRILRHLAASPNAAALEDWILSMLRGDDDRSTETYGRILQLAAGGMSSTASSDDLSQVLDWLAASLENTGSGGIREMVQTLDELMISDENHAILTIMRSLIAPGPLASRERPITTYGDVASAVGAVDPANMCMATGRELDPAALEETVTGLTEFLARDPNDSATSGIEQIWSLIGSIAPEE